MESAADYVPKSIFIYFTQTNNKISMESEQITRTTTERIWEQTDKQKKM